jgi:non-ribosomal peptide synthetase component E (peptide arylation enzyme)
MNFLEQNSDIKKLIHSKTPAVITSKCTLSYLELESEMIKTTSALIESGIKKDDYVLIRRN